MASQGSKLLPTSELQIGSKTASPNSSSSTYILTPPKQDFNSFSVLEQYQTLPTNNNRFPPRTSSLKPPRKSLLPDVGLKREESFQLDATVGQIQLTRMLQKSKHRITLLFSPRTTHPQAPDCGTNPNPSPISFEKTRAFLTPVPCRTNKFWLSGAPPSQKCKDKAERKILQRMSPHTRERRTLTVESGRKMLELEDERIAVRDFQPEHDQVKEEETKAKEMKAAEEKAKAATLSSKLADDPAVQKLMEEPEVIASC